MVEAAAAVLSFLLAAQAQQPLVTGSDPRLTMLLVAATEAEGRAQA